MSAFDVTASVTLDGPQVAEAFWALDAEQQADFFAKLERIAGLKLCFQMAGVVDEIRRRSERGDREAMQGFQTMLSHAEGYAESATDYRVWQAQREIAALAELSKDQP